MFPKNKFFCLICFFIIFSCGEKLNFSQAEDYIASPSYSFSITYFEVSASNFTPVSGAPAVTQVTEETEFRVFQNEIIKTNLKKVDWQFEIDNNFNRDFTIEIILLDTNGNSIKRLNDLKIQANTLNTPPVETILVSANPNIKNTARVRITIKLDDPTRPVSSTESGSFNFKSASTVYLETSFK